MAKTRLKRKQYCLEKVRWGGIIFDGILCTLLESVSGAAVITFGFDSKTFFEHIFLAAIQYYIRMQLVVPVRSLACSISFFKFAAGLRLENEKVASTAR